MGLRSVTSGQWWPAWPSLARLSETGPVGSRLSTPRVMQGPKCIGISDPSGSEGAAWQCWRRGNKSVKSTTKVKKTIIIALSFVIFFQLCVNILMFTEVADANIPD